MDTKQGRRVNESYVLLFKNILLSHYKLYEYQIQKYIQI
jgi:hypothetical protein